MFQHTFHGGNNGGGNPEVNTNPQKSTILTVPGQRPNPPNIPVYRGTTHIFYKTRICQKFIDGTCRNGDTCTFAHGPHDLREPPPNWQEYAKDNKGGYGSGNWNDDQTIIHRMRICRKFYNGEECPYGDKCNFLHESPAKFKNEIAMDAERTRESFVIDIPVVDLGQTKTEVRQDTVNVVNADQDGSRASVKFNYYKTRLCGKWETSGQCMFADKCHFAHGVAELNNPAVRADGVVHPYTASSAAANLVHGPITEPVATDSSTHAPVKRLGRGFLKLAAKKKVKGIYGDWIGGEEDELN
ncbi:zinc finger CCCH domain-containing protein 39-like [Rutidosis leptorrhynchoides]|uniref:zinc finger CCCH domain-containing protein 39-like n=1 Tax=Rutidosis leptorrhynchoides TaxID=125765 RepID=UPI003A991425